MTFSIPSINIGFKLSVCALGTSPAKGYVWNGDIKPWYSVVEGKNTFEKWYWGDCSIETLKYAYKLTEKTKSVKVKREDWEAGSDKVVVENSLKYIFTVSNDIKNIHETSYEGFITEEEFTTLANMLLNDVEAAKMKRTASTNMEQVTQFATYLTKKLGELSELKKSPSAN